MDLTKGTKHSVTGTEKNILLCHNLSVSFAKLSNGLDWRFQFWPAGLMFDIPVLEKEKADGCGGEYYGQANRQREREQSWQFGQGRARKDLYL